MLVVLVAVLMQVATQGPVSLVRYLKTHAPSFFFFIFFFFLGVIPGVKVAAVCKDWGRGGGKAEGLLGKRTLAC